MNSKFWINAVGVAAASIATYWLVPKAVAKADPLTGRLQPSDQWMETPDALGWGAGTYEPEIKAIYDKEGKEAALIAWLRRNKAYGLRYKLRATPNYKTMVLTESGPRVPPRWGFFHWKGTIKDGPNEWFESMPGIGLGFVHVYLRCGWKLKPLFLGERPEGVSAIGLFMGVTPRMDDWDDYAGKK